MVKKEIVKNIRKIFSEEQKTVPYSWMQHKQYLEEKIITITLYIRKKKNLINNVTFNNVTRER